MSLSAVAVDFTNPLVAVQEHGDDDAYPGLAADRNGVTGCGRALPACGPGRPRRTGGGDDPKAIHCPGTARLRPDYRWVMSDDE